jgi:hypothetical protein
MQRLPGCSSLILLGALLLLRSTLPSGDLIVSPFAELTVGSTLEGEGAYLIHR